MIYLNMVNVKNQPKVMSVHFLITLLLCIWFGGITANMIFISPIMLHHLDAIQSGIIITQIIHIFGYFGIVCFLAQIIYVSYSVGWNTLKHSIFWLSILNICIMIIGCFNYPHYIKTRINSTFEALFNYNQNNWRIEFWQLGFGLWMIIISLCGLAYFIANYRNKS